MAGTRGHYRSKATPSKARVLAIAEFCAAKGLKGMIQERPMSEANEALLDLEAGKPRYRYVLVNESA